MSLKNPFHMSIEMISLYERMLDSGVMSGADADADAARERLAELRRGFLEIDDFSFVNDPDFPLRDFNRVVEVLDSDGNTMQLTLLSLAARRMNVKGITTILYSEDSNANPNIGDPTPLMAAMANCKGKPLVAWDMIDTLVDWGADVNAVSPRGDTALTMLAEADGDVETARRLLNKGADPMLGDAEKVERLMEWLDGKGLAFEARSITL